MACKEAEGKEMIKQSKSVYTCDLCLNEIDGAPASVCFESEKTGVTFLNPQPMRQSQNDEDEWESLDLCLSCMLNCLSDIEPDAAASQVEWEKAKKSGK